MNTLILIMAVVLIVLHSLNLTCALLRREVNGGIYTSYELAVPSIGMGFGGIMLFSHIIDSFVVMNERLAMMLLSGGFSLGFFCFAMMFVPFAVRLTSGDVFNDPLKFIKTYGFPIVSGLGILFSAIMGSFI